MDNTCLPLCDNLRRHLVLNILPDQSTAMLVVDVVCWMSFPRSQFYFRYYFCSFGLRVTVAPLKLLPNTQYQILSSVLTHFNPQQPCQPVLERKPVGLSMPVGDGLCGERDALKKFDDVYCDQTAYHVTTIVGSTPRGLRTKTLVIPHISQCALIRFKAPLHGNPNRTFTSSNCTESDSSPHWASDAHS
jgi:hypothetical protein